MGVIEKLIEKGFEKETEILKGLKQDSIHMVTEKSTEEEFKIGESKIGGMPHLPKGYTWPTYQEKPLAFLAQINLAEFASYDLKKQLPEKGMLYFFHEGGEEIWGFDPKDEGGFLVEYIEEPMGLVQTDFPEALEDYMRFSPCKVTYEIKESYPSDAYELNETYFNGEGNNEFFEILFENEMCDTVNKLFGYPGLIQGDIFLESQLVTNGLYCGDPTGYNDPRAKELEKGAGEWMLLFQIDSDNNAEMMWGDVGRIYFTIKKEDLKNRRFAQAWSAFQCG